MIEVSVEPCGIIVAGHANYAEHGKDIVCAAVTALVQTLIKSFDDLTHDKIKWDIEPGTAFIKYRDLSEAGRLLVDSFFLGICQIVDEFPEYVKISTEMSENYSNGTDLDGLGRKGNNEKQSI